MNCSKVFLANSLGPNPHPGIVTPVRRDIMGDSAA